MAEDQEAAKCCSCPLKQVQKEESQGQEHKAVEGQQQITKEDAALQRSRSTSSIPEVCDPCLPSGGPVKSEVLDQLEKGYADLMASNSQSLLKKYLTPELFEQLKTKFTPYGSTLLDVIRSGLAHYDSQVGVYAPDQYAYDVFADLFNPIIREIHDFAIYQKHPTTYWGESGKFEALDEKRKYIVSTRIRCGRSVVGYPFSPKMTRLDHENLEIECSDAFELLKQEYKGTYSPYPCMPVDFRQELVDQHILFTEEDKYLQEAMVYEDWPVGRGIFMNEKQDFIIWLGESDHLRFISMEKGGDIGRVHRRLMVGVRVVEKKLNFVRNNRLGFLSICPTNLGTVMRASVLIKLPNLGKSDTFVDLCRKLNLEIRGTQGEHSEASHFTFDISNKRRLGLTEAQVLDEMVLGIRVLIEEEEKLNTPAPKKKKKKKKKKVKIKDTKKKRKKSTKKK